MGLCVQSGAILSALTQLSALTSLCVSHVDAETFASLQALSQLAELKSLQVDLGGPLSPRSLMCLTAMTALTCLEVDAKTVPDFDGAAAVNLSCAGVAQQRLHDVCRFIY